MSNGVDGIDIWGIMRNLNDGENIFLSPRVLHDAAQDLNSASKSSLHIYNDQRVKAMINSTHNPSYKIIYDVVDDKMILSRGD